MKIAVFTKNRINPAYAAARLGADRAAAEFGAQTVHFVPLEPDNPEQQAALIRDALAQAPDAFVLAPVHPTRVNEAIRSIELAGIPIFSFITRLTEAQSVSHVGSDDGLLATHVAEYLFEHMPRGGNVVLVEGPAIAPTSVDRVEAFRRVAERYPAVRIVAECNGDYQRQAAQSACAEVLAQHAQVDAVLAANDVMALGALDALHASGRHALVAGVNAIPEAIGAIKSGQMLVTADFNAMQICYVATECAIRHLQGEDVPKDVVLPAEVVDITNYQRWDLPFEQRSLTPLRELVAPPER
jgi:ribose transport system substrate-binding protein